MRKIYLVTEYEYHKHKDSDPIVKLMTFDFSKARLEANKIFNDFTEKDNIDKTDTEETYYACFNYGFGAGTMTIEVEIAESEEDLKNNACGANNLKSFLKANGFSLPKGAFPKAKYFSCVMKLAEEKEGFRDEIEQILREPVPEKNARKPKRKLELEDP